MRLSLSIRFNDIVSFSDSKDDASPFSFVVKVDGVGFSFWMDDTENWGALCGVDRLGIVGVVAGGDAAAKENLGKGVATAAAPGVAAVLVVDANETDAKGFFFLAGVGVAVVRGVDPAAEDGGRKPLENRALLLCMCVGRNRNVDLRN